MCTSPGNDPMTEANQYVQDSSQPLRGTPIVLISGITTIALDLKQTGRHGHLVDGFDVDAVFSTGTGPAAR
jgi:hypothetical protein